MSEGPEWFAPKRYGYGSGVPITWQGWVVIIGFVVLLALATLVLPFSLIAYFSIVATLTAALLFICARTTRGGWRWRWGDRD
jgi:hypothetical protein